MVSLETGNSKLETYAPGDRQLFDTPNPKSEIRNPTPRDATSGKLEIHHQTLQVRKERFKLGSKLLVILDQLIGCFIHFGIKGCTS